MFYQKHNGEPDQEYHSFGSVDNNAMFKLIVLFFLFGYSGMNQDISLNRNQHFMFILFFMATGPYSEIKKTID